jgi:hypothetical protein
VRFLRRSSDDTSADTTRSTGDPDASENADDERVGTHTAGKGRPTPKRRDAEGKRRGPVPPPPKTQREALRRSRGNREERRAATADRRERMMSGDEKLLPPRDRGPVKAYVRDVVDSRRNIMGLFMPMALVLFVILLVPNPAVQQYVSLVFMVMLVAMVAEAVLLGIHVTRRVRVRFPGSENSGFALGWYSFSRASQLRKLRIPRPKVSYKDAPRVG